VLQIVHVDEKERTVYFTASGREKGNPYFQYLYRIGLDGKSLTLLTAEEGTHTVEMSPSKKFFTDAYSQPDVPPVTVLRDSAGKLVATIEKTDVSSLQAAGWKPLSHHGEGT